jgi:hypothetical protein
MAYGDPGCPPDIFGPDKPGMLERHDRTDRDRSREERDLR